MGFCDVVASAGPIQTTISTPRHSTFAGLMLFLMTNEQCQSTEGKYRIHTVYTKGKNNKQMTASLTSSTYLPCQM